MIFPGQGPRPSVSHSREQLTLADFSAGRPDLGWYIVNDDVMGGRSEGTISLENGHLRFSGRTNTSGGGFSSIRTRPLQLDLSRYDGIRLCVKGDGRRYTGRLTTSEQLRGSQVGYWAEFDTRDGTRTIVDIPFCNFAPRVRGKPLDGPPLDTGDVTGIGLMIYDKQDGPFELQLFEISAYAAGA